MTALSDQIESDLLSCVVASDQVGFTKYTSPPHHPPHLLTSLTTSPTVERRTSERRREEQLCTPHHLATCIADSTITSEVIKINTPHLSLIKTYGKRVHTTPSPHHLIDYFPDHHLTGHLTDHHRTYHFTTESSPDAAAA